ncbi:HAMP domain-containing sensor histidine kinase [Frigoribacterium sp. PvP032]|uniref:sensor histidine kinase n=1 Tax=Frigoribacterium sp. PvP032 TaxID=2806589 RepID=UPI001AE58185|nr:HAMP domain-containing sensor histidine kinase [Frigoribacterium sp. PvP032]MBP1190111.1 two-component system OmpR family sensor kinase [Frigoribacterium sp. PvP032]
MPRASAPLTLRNRLILSIVAIVVLLTVVIGTVSVVALRGSLMRQLDDDLASATSRAVAAASIGGSAGRPSLSPDSDAFSEPRQAPGTFTAVLVGDVVQQAFTVTETGELVDPLTDEITAALASVPDAGGPVTVSLGSDLGGYRVEAVPVTLTSRSGSSSSTGAVSTGYLVVGLPTESVTQTVAGMIASIAFVTLLGLVVAILIAYAVVRRALRPLERLSDTALRVAELPLDRGEVALAERVDEQDTDTRTEVGRVGASLNHMLGHVAAALEARQQSENKVRQFVADASHELRTPLASVRGYAELTRRMGAGLPDDVVYAMGRIESESLRMTSLVEDLLLLARLDEGRDIVVADVDLTRVVLDAVNDAAVADPAHDVDVVLPDEPVVVPGDAMRLHQIVANLLTNSRTHTPEGTPVHVALAVDAAARCAVVTVSDEGPGIDPAVLPVLFERFARADSSRSRKAGSTGLGLAIVEAVAHAHGGDVSVASSADGAVFTVRLPLAGIPAASAPRAAERATT